MASPAATKRLGKEYKSITENPPPFITAHPSESNILEWHYIITGPPQTPYEGGQYWGTLVFPPDYPFAPPSIRMHTPSGRFQPSARLCLSISDFHPKSWKPAWEVSTILIGLMSFMTSEEMTTGSVRGTDVERRAYAARSRWWNSTGGGSAARASSPPNSSNARGVGAIRSGDGGAKFRAEWPELDAENWKVMRERRIDVATGSPAPSSSSSSSSSANPQGAGHSSCTPGVKLPAGLNSKQGAVVEGAQVARNAGQGWLGRNKLWVLAAVVFSYVVVARLFGDNGGGDL